MLTDLGAVLHRSFRVLMGRGGVFLRQVVAAVVGVVTCHSMVMRRSLVVRCRVVMMFAGGMLALRHLEKDSFGLNQFAKPSPAEATGVPESSSNLAGS
jgi:hypothetical protein